MRSRRGVTLLELLVALGIGGMLATALSAAFSSAVRFSIRVPEARESFLDGMQLEDRLRSLIECAFVDEDQANPNTYFIGRSDPFGDSSLDTGEASTELVFTALGRRVRAEALEPTNDAFEDRNAQIGPVGGVTEVRLGLTPVGNVDESGGLYLREQTPADEDPDQGGYESILDSRVASIGFEFWDGYEWLATWDTQSGERRVPAAVRVTYTLSDEEDVQRVMVIPLRSSDVTAANPANQSTTGATL